MLDEVALGVNDVEQLLRVHLLRGGEDDHLEHRRDAVHELVQVRPLLHMDDVVLKSVEGGMEEGGGGGRWEGEEWHSRPVRTIPGASQPLHFESTRAHMPIYMERGGGRCI